MVQANIQDFNFNKLLNLWKVISKKIAKEKSKRRFLLRCRSYNVLPPRILQRSKNLFNIEFFDGHNNTQLHCYLNILYKRLLNLEISDVNNRLKYYLKQSNNLNINLNKHTQYSEFLTFFFKHYWKLIIKLSYKLNNSHRKKFYNMLNSQKPDILASITDKNYLGHDVLHHNNPTDIVNENIHLNALENNTIINLSNVLIPNNVNDVVSLGEKYSISHDLNNSCVMDAIKGLEFSLSRVHIHDDIKDDFREKVTNILSNNYNKKHKYH